MTHRYHPQLWASWALIMIGTGLLSTLREDTARLSAIGFQIVVGAGIGIISTTAFFPVLAPLRISDNAKALAYYTFLRNFGQVSDLPQF